MVIYRMYVSVVLCILLFISSFVNAGYVKIKPLDDNMKLYDDEAKDFVFNITLQTDSPNNHRSALRFVSTNAQIATVYTNEIFPAPENKVSNVTVNIRGLFLGGTNIKILVNQSLNGTVKGDNPLWHEYKETFSVVVSRRNRPVDTAFTVVVIILTCLANVAMGCKTDLAVVKATLKKPIAPLTGLASQYILMPLISFALGIIFKLDAALAIGLFVTGCSPGGSFSNVYTHLLDGDVSLSVTMTFVSTVTSLGFIPLWLYSLGINYIYVEASTVKIPYENIMASLVGLLIPIGIGIFIQKKKPIWAKRILKTVSYITALILIFIFTVGVYANLYIFKLLTPIVLISGALSPYCGFLFGAFVAFMTKQTSKNILTIALETGIQNTAIAVVLLKVSLPAPDSDISIAPPVSCALFTPIPLIIALLVHYIRKRRLKKTPTELDMLDDTYPEKNTKNGEPTKCDDILNKSNSSDDTGNDTQNKQIKT